MRINKTKLRNIMKKQGVLGMTALAMASSGVGLIGVSVLSGTQLGNVLSLGDNAAHADVKTIDTGHDGIKIQVDQLTGAVTFTGVNSVEGIAWVKAHYITKISAYTDTATLLDGTTIPLHHISGSASKWDGLVGEGGADTSVYTAGSGHAHDNVTDDSFTFGDGGFYFVPTKVGDMDTPVGPTAGPIQQHSTVTTANGSHTFDPVVSGGGVDGNTDAKGGVIRWFDWTNSVSVHAWVDDNVDIGTQVTIFGDQDGIPTPTPTIKVTQPNAPKPTKTVTNGGKNIDGGTTTPDQEWDFSVNQNLPAAIQAGLHYDSIHFEDNVPATAKIQTAGIKVVDENGVDNTGNFDISVSGQKVTADAHSDWMNGGSNMGHTYSLKIPTLVNLDDQTKTVADLKTDNVATVSVNDNPLASNHVTVSPKFNTPSVAKAVSVNAGKSWVTDAKLSGHDVNYDYKVDYTLSDHVQFATLQLRDYVEDLQSVGKVTVLDGAGNDVTGDFIITGLPAAGANTDGKQAQATITATAKNAAKYARVGGTLSLLLSDVTLKGDGAQDDINYYDSTSKTIKIPNIADMYWQDTTPTPDEPNTLKSNKTNVTPPTPTTPKVTKQVSVDGGKTWTNPAKEIPAQLLTHDSEYTWMTNFNLTNYFNFDGAGSLKLTDHFENLQKYSNVKIVQGADDQGNGGTDITSKFDISTKDTSDTGKDIVASVKAANANDFDDIGGTKDIKLANVKMIITGTTVKGATASQELNYLTKDGNVDIPNISTLTEDDNVTTDYYKRNKDSNKAWVRLARVNPGIDKYVEQDGDSSLVDAQDVDVDKTETAEKDASSNSMASSSVASSSVASSETSSSTSSSVSSSANSSDSSLTINDAIDYANDVLSSLDNMATPYPDAVTSAENKLVSIAGDRTSSASDVKSAADTLKTTIEAAIKDGSLKEAK